MQLVEDTCRALDVHAVHLDVERINEAAQTLYRGFGFEDHDRYLMTQWIVALPAPHETEPARH
jgi:diamine N-acetyltransferase